MKADQEEIILEIINLRVKKGYSINSLLKHLMSTYDYSQARGYQLIAAAREEMGKAFEKYYDNRLKDSVMQLEAMLQTSLEEKNLRQGLEILKEINKVSQLYQEKLDITSGGEPITIKIIKDVGNTDLTDL
jgi:hypothetical protein